MTETEYSVSIKNQQFENSRLRSIIRKQKETIEGQRKTILALRQKNENLERNKEKFRNDCASWRSI